MKFRLIDAAHWLTRILRVGNWLLMAAMAVMLIYSLPMQDDLVAHIASRHFGPDPTAQLNGLRIITLLGITWTIANDLILNAMGRMIATARGGDPFVAANAERLRTIGWALVATQVCAFVIGYVAAPMGMSRLSDMYGFSLGGWIAVLIAFVLRRSIRPRHSHAR